jgi:hypothetical protein
VGQPFFTALCDYDFIYEILYNLFGATYALYPINFFNLIVPLSYPLDFFSFLDL